MAHAAMAIRLLLTGCQKNESLSLGWDNVDLEAGETRLRDAKTGPRTVQLSPAATAVLARVPRARNESSSAIGLNGAGPQSARPRRPFPIPPS